MTCPRAHTKPESKSLIQSSPFGSPKTTNSANSFRPCRIRSPGPPRGAGVSRLPWAPKFGSAPCPHRLLGGAVEPSYRQGQGGWCCFTLCPAPAASRRGPARGRHCTGPGPALSPGVSPSSRVSGPGLDFARRQGPEARERRWRPSRPARLSREAAAAPRPSGAPTAPNGPLARRARPRATFPREKRIFPNVTSAARLPQPLRVARSRGNCGLRPPSADRRPAGSGLPVRSRPARPHPTPPGLGRISPPCGCEAGLEAFPAPSPGPR
ncbi:uncharacterized protein C16orf46 homolog isoform X2 [Macrotis lagotis]|uniref:uncharacterized protein C16orf46 homolog isoform X2 n=1 Tax=Macrotis lagotis TaxID=92651 RepID=UPI003D6997AC